MEEKVISDEWNQRAFRIKKEIAKTAKPIKLGHVRELMAWMAGYNSVAAMGACLRQGSGIQHLPALDMESIMPKAEKLGLDAGHVQVFLTVIDHAG